MCDGVCMCVCMQHQSEGIRKAAMWTLGKLCLVWCRHVADDDRGSLLNVVMIFKTLNQQGLLLLFGLFNV